MSPPDKIPAPLGGCYDDLLGVCYPADAPECQLQEENPPPREPKDNYIAYSPQRLVYEAFGKSTPSVRPKNIWESNPLSSSLLTVALLPLSVAGCGETEETPALAGAPIALIEPVTSETILNDEPILGKVRQVGIASNGGSRSTVAWSVSDFLNPDLHGTFAFIQEGETTGSQTTVSSSLDSIPRDTSVAVLDNGDSIVLFSRIQGDDAPSSVVAQRINGNGDVIGDEIEILPSTIRSSLPEAQVVSTGNGFIAVYKDGEGKLGAAEFDAQGSEVGRQELSSFSPLRFKISRGQGNHWALAEIAGSSQIRVRTFSSLSPAGVDTTVSTGLISASPNLSLAMQPDGVMMLAWNALQGADNRVIEGTFLDGAGSQVGPVRILRDLVIGVGNDQEDHFNSHNIAPDGRGNFIFTYEENRNLIATVFSGSQPEGSHLSNISSKTLDASGPYADLLAGLQNYAVQNVDVRVGVTPIGAKESLLSFVYTKIMSGDDPANETTETIQRITRRDYRIIYE